MAGKTLLAAACVVFAMGMQDADAQQVQLATFQEIAQVIVNPDQQSNSSASITLQSTSNQEIKIPSQLEDRILQNGRIVSILVTNEDSCVLGVTGESCIMINVNRSDDWEGIIETQEAVRGIGDMFIKEINGMLDTDAQYHSVFLHHRDEANVAFGTSGLVSGRNTVSAVYTMPMESTDSMYEKLSALLLADVIAESGGYHDAAKKLSAGNDAKMTFSIIAHGSGLLYQLKTSVYHTESEGSGLSIMPLELLRTDRLDRSEYFSQGFYPLNSLIQVLVLGDKWVQGAQPPFVDTTQIDGDNIPADLTQSGWVDNQDKRQGELIFLFGQDTSVVSGDLVLLPYPDTPPGEPLPGESYVVIAAIVAAAAAAAVFFLRGYKKGSD